MSISCDTYFGGAHRNAVHEQARHEEEVEYQATIPSHEEEDACRREPAGPEALHFAVEGEQVVPSNEGCKELLRESRICEYQDTRGLTDRYEYPEADVLAMYVAH